MNSDDVADYLELTQLKHEYCHRIDHGEYQGWVNLFTDDGSFVRVGTDRYDGHDELRTFVNDVFDEGFEYTAHMVTNPVIDIDGDEATGRWYLYLPYVTPDGETGWKQARYEDEFRRVDGEWKIETVELYGRASQSTEHTSL